MYIRGRGEVYMLNRSDAVFRVPYLSFPSGRHLGEHLTETLLDGVSLSWYHRAPHVYNKLTL